MSTPPVVIIIGPHRAEFATNEEAIAYLQNPPLAGDDPAGDGSSES
jgi:hypothetical protein